MFPGGVTQNGTMLPNFDKSYGRPIDDLRKGDFSPEEAKLRCQLASLYRLVDLFHWSQGIFNHMTVRESFEDLESTSTLCQTTGLFWVRLPGNDVEILINPFGLLYHEQTASTLVKVNLEGKTLHPGSTKLGINQAGYTLHSAIHGAREDLKCVIHLHTPAVAAVSAMKCGLLPLCQEAMIVGPVAYHEYEGIVDLDEKESLVQDMGSHNVMILRNHGFVVGGATIEEAFHLTYHLILACQTQVQAMRCGGIDALNLPKEKAAQRAFETAANGGGGVLRRNGVIDKHWSLGELEWQAWMRALDDMGLRTGYEHRPF